MDADRRQFFRINQQVAMDISLLSEDQSNATMSTHFEVPPSFAAICQLHEQDVEAQMMLHRISARDAELARYLQLMSERINVLARTLVSHDIDFNRLVTRDVNLSEGGMLFYYPDALPADGIVEIKLIFPAAELGLLLRARILRCEPIDGNLFEVALEFCQLAESTRTLLARQIMESQSQTLSRRSQIA